MGDDTTKEKLFRFFDQVVTPVILVDRSRRTQYANRSAEALFGDGAGELRNAMTSLGFSSDRPVLSWEDIWEHVVTKGAWEGALSHVLQNGTTLRTACSISALDDNGDDMFGFLIIIHDMSRIPNDQSPSEIPDTNAYSLLREFHQMVSVGRITGVLVHDFNNHLAGILGNLSVAMRKLDPDHPVHPLLRAARKSAERSADLVKQLKSFSNRSTTVANASSSPMELNRIVEEIRNLLLSKTSGNQSIRFGLSPDLPQIAGDASQIGSSSLYQICLNILVF